MRIKGLLLAIILVSLTFTVTGYTARLHELRILGGTGGVTVIKVEVAATPQERAKGLMFRDKLSEGRGMWFIFDEDTMNSFWMKNTLISLDMIFVDSNLDIVSISENAVPKSEKQITPSKPYRYVLEVPAGFVAEHHLKKGLKVRLMTD